MRAFLFPIWGPGLAHMKRIGRMQDTSRFWQGIEYAERPGTGPVLVALHGIGSNAGSFAPLVAALPGDWRIIAWNAPGYRGSAPLAADWPVAADYAEALAAFTAGLELPRFFLLGHSLGALVAASFACRFSQRLCALCLASCALGHNAAPGGPLSPASAERIADLAAMGPATFARARAPRLVHAPEAHPSTTALVVETMAEIRMPGYGQAARMLASGDLCTDLAALTRPASVIYGAEDVVTPPAGNLQAHAAIPASMRGPVIELPGAGHAVYQQAPRAFAAALTSTFAKMIDPRSKR